MKALLYPTWKEELGSLLAKHKKLLRFNRKAGIGTTGEIEIQIEIVEDKIKELNEKITKYERENGTEENTSNTILIVQDSNVPTKHLQEKVEIQNVIDMNALELNLDDKKAIQDFFEKLPSKKLNEEIVIEKMELIESKIESMRNDLPAKVLEIWDSKKKLSTDMSIDGKFKTKIPIVPFILHYEIEGKSNLKDVFKQIWIDFQNGDIFFKD